MSAPPDPAKVRLDAEDIQGNVLAGFRKDNTLLAFFTLTDASAFRASMAQVARRISSHAEVAAFNRAFRASAKRLHAEPPVQAAWANVALSASGLAALGFDPSGVRDVAFRQGLAQRSSLLGDPWRRGVAGSPDTWVVGGTTTPCDGIFIVAADDPSDMMGLADSILSELRGATVTLRFEGATLPGPMRGHEHFGFKDGISQPLVRGVDDSHADAAVLPLIWPGEFVFGYPTQNGDAEAPGPLSGREQSWLRNGSFLVVRILRQNVALFQRAMNERAAKEGVDVLTQAAKSVGRWPSGAPASRSPSADDPALAADRAAANAFLFESPVALDRFGPVPADRAGERCPLNAHVRKAWPRDSALDGKTTPVTALRVHRIIRRGTPYGPVSSSTFAAPVDDGVDRGLVFLAYQTSIATQFEFITRAWLNGEDFPPGAGIDPVFGCGEASSPPWITPRGGGYFFSPSLSFLRALGTRFLS